MEIDSAVRPGHVEKYLSFTALIKVDFKELKHVTCKKLTKYASVLFL